jgi:hypothetical protein
MIEHRANLFHGYTRKPFDELIDVDPILQVFEKRSNRHARTSKHPRAAKTFGITFNYRTSRPIQHVIIVARESAPVKLRAIH